MNFHEGDPVMHWTYGFGKVIRLEERDLSGQKTMYYAVQVGDLTVWVPADDMLMSRLRPPTPQAEFKKLFAILSRPGDQLPVDRQARKTLLVEMLKDGRAESLCTVIRNLTTYRHTHPLNYNDEALLKRARNALLGEWGFALSVTTLEAEMELHRLLAFVPAGD